MQTEMLGWLDLYRETGDDRYLTATERAGEFVIGNLDGDRDEDIIVGDIGNTNRTAVLINVINVINVINEKKTENNSDDFIFLELDSNPPVTNGSPHIRIAKCLVGGK